MLNEALDHHWDSLKVAAGETVQYVRGSSSFYVDAVVGQSIFDESSSDGENRSLAKSVDFLIHRNDLAKHLATDPQRGDQIKKENGEVYDLLPGSGNTSWQWSDGRQTHYRIHTVRRKGKS
jgi:hypothetical protein